MSESLDFVNVSFFYDTLGSPVISGLTVQLSRGWTGIVGANGAGKTPVPRCRPRPGR